MPITEEEKIKRRRMGQKRYRENNKEKLVLARRKYYLENKEAIDKKSTEWAASHRDIVNERNRKYKEKPKSKEIRRAWSKNNSDKWKKYNNDSYCKRSTELTDAYVRELLRAGQYYKLSDIPQFLVELKRQQIILMRTIKEIRKCKT